MFTQTTVCVYTHAHARTHTQNWIRNINQNYEYSLLIISYAFINRVQGAAEKELLQSYCKLFNISGQTFHFDIILIAAHTIKIQWTVLNRQMPFPMGPFLFLNCHIPSRGLGNFYFHFHVSNRYWRIWGSHSGEDADVSLLGSNASTLLGI